MRINIAGSACSGSLAAFLALGCGKVESNEPAPDVGSGGGGATSAISTVQSVGGGSSTQGGSTEGTQSVETSSTEGGGEGGSDPLPTWGCAQQLVSGDEHTCVLYTDGRVACFGSNGFGQLGTGSSSNSEVFTAVPLEPVTLIAAGGNNTCASDGPSVYCWGDNRAFQLGVDASEQSSTPVLTASSQMGVAQLALGEQHACYIDQIVHGYCWGTGAGATLAAPAGHPRIGLQEHEFVQLGGSLTRLVSGERLYDLSWDPAGEGAYVATPDAPVGILQNAIAADHDCVLKRSGSVWCRGAGYEPFYTAVGDFGDEVLEVEVSNGFDCARTREGEVRCRGRNDAAQLGNGRLEDSVRAYAVSGIEDAVEISLGAAHACARRSDGSVWCWGTPPGIRILTVPQLFSTPTSGELCDAVPSAPRPWDLPFPEASGAEELFDARVAFGQNICRCRYTDADELEACLANDQVRVLTGCYQALAGNRNDDALCEAELTWGAADCSAGCVDTGNEPEDCGRELYDNLCGTAGSVFDFCKHSSLPCNGPMSETRVSWRDTCNGVPECENGFDEANCTPNAEEFVCADGSTVALDRVANASADCLDGSDEWLP